MKRMILIILVTWILSLVTTLAFVYVVIPNILRPRPATWHEVTGFSGTFQEFDIEDTDIFYIPSDHWRLHWTVTTGTPPPDDVEFRLFIELNSTHGRYYPSLVWLKSADFQASQHPDDGQDWWGYRDGTEYVTGSGWSSFRLRGARLDWEITVEAYY